MSEMVERIAAVIAAEIMELTADQRATFRFPDDANGDTCDRARSAAVLVLDAMREPTESMMAAVDCAGEKKQWISGQAWIAGWQAMIDECLK